ncbi:MAG: radical SAM protein [Bacteroidales bacterium]|nr:radical SAM protein [Bacteroidales bacterium]
MRRFIECLIPVTACNLKCSYCYVVQEGRRKNEKANFRYDAETIGKALSVERLGGVSLISITGSGETLIPKELPDVVREILRQGHFVNITTNGTLKVAMQKLLDATEGMHDRLHFSFSFHVRELQEKNLLEAFWENVDRVKQSGCSILLQINLSDEYWDCWEEVKQMSLEHVGALPQVALTRDESNNTYKIMTRHSEAEYIAKAREMNSPLFECTLENFMVKRTEYCYAGMWSAKLDICSGEMSACYGHGRKQNIFEDLEKPIVFEPVGKHCPFKYCFNSSHFISQGIIPELMPQTSYGDLRNRAEAGWQTDAMREFLSKQFEDTNKQLTEEEKERYDGIYRRLEMKNRIASMPKKIVAIVKRLGIK